MGNSIYGSTPSTVWTLIRTNVLNPNDEKHRFNVQKFDFIEEMIKLGELEHEFLEMSINYYNSKKKGYSSENWLYNIIPAALSWMWNVTYAQNLKDMHEKTKALMIEMIRLELIPNDQYTELLTKEPHYFEVSNQFNEDYKGELRTVACDTFLLDLTYGLFQLEMAQELLQDIEVIANSLEEKNELVYQIIKDRWSLLSEDQKSSRTMQNSVVEQVKPCQMAFNNWWNNSIL